MRFLFHGILAWAVSALALLPAAAFIISAAGINSGAAGYISSALSFLAALFAGRAAAVSYTHLDVYKRQVLHTCVEKRA